MESPERSAAVDEPENYPWHMKCALIVVVIATLCVCIGVWRGDTHTDLRDVAHATLWTTYSVGNPKTVQYANLRKSRLSENILCGRINYEQVDNKGWSGYTDFFIEKGVMYISPPTGRFFKTFTDYCLTMPNLP